MTYVFIQHKDDRTRQVEAIGILGSLTPYINDHTESVPETVVHNHLLHKVFQRILREVVMLSVLPPYKATGKTNYNAIDNGP